MSKPISVAIVGAGIIGVTTALRIKELIPNAILTIYSDEYSPYTTSDVSAGYWEPFCLGELDSVQKNRILKWSKEAYDVFLGIVRSDLAERCGVQMLSAYVLEKDENFIDPFWTKAVLGYRRLSNNELNELGFSKSGAKGGFVFSSTTVVVKKYLPFLLTELEKLGVKFAKIKINHLTEFIADDDNKTNYVINCTGLGARELCGDLNMYPTRGQVLRVEAPWIKHAVMFDNGPLGCAYILPLSKLTVVGGTVEDNNYSRKVDEEECKRIIERTSLLVPSIKNAKIIEKGAGLRPSRKGGVRLEMETLKNDIGQVKVIHNYGHGGSGVTLSWGCATEVTQIIKQDMNQLKSNL